MKLSMRKRLEDLSDRLKEIDLMLADSAVFSNIEEFRKLSCERSEIEPVVKKFSEFLSVEFAILNAQDILADPDLKDLAEEEIKFNKKNLVELENSLQLLLIPKDPNDDRSFFLEIRAGTGGDESALFSSDLLRMYIRYAEQKGWRVELISESVSDFGGYKEVIIRIDGHGAYSHLKFESGGHRVQRVPDTETQGRIHTSACTVAVMLEADAVNDVSINSSDIRIDTFRASGAGGQHINKTDSAVRITHLPTGLVVECQDDRSQHRNKDKAMKVLAARLKDKEIRELQNKEAAERKGLIGSGDRSERIRTYNFPQNRITDHRINLTLYKLSQIMEGDMSELIGSLLSEYQAEQLANLNL
ncbi:peptide chain release factor RF-1 [Candidatus Kinetoplastibacterium desouzaii TCC079E]|uniref:Peptide chain release factor 1 n=1 Tax=Candidatus Kinetoplastidibacterium desouzai TCC079E TaxID=1208919 RepID=M1LR41_9PROT|nr:peptide chain release factor 1 [Candidatus Kinetoplastibacterium desouzaii]AGF46631.1 peptide chain release factor RF-1 [Candidatus Kinetoplastibacterium desouzaii TCC079E]